MARVLIDVVAGARPNFIKIAAIIEALDAHALAGGALRYRVIHTGQHYDKQLSGAFFEQLGLPEPTVNFDVGSGSQAGQAAAIMQAYENYLLEKGRPALTLVVGDVTSTMACAITAQKLHVPVAHVEGGIRSGDWTMPEEINRLATDAITDWFFTTSEDANRNLRYAGVGEERIFFVGNTMIDTLLRNRQRFRAPNWFASEHLDRRPYLVLTLHRPSNVDDEHELAALLSTIETGAKEVKIVFPVHPRTRKMIARLARTRASDMLLVDPQPYLEFNYLVERASGVITDSGGITEEATVLGIPCMTLRDSTERPETVTIGTNVLVGTQHDAIVEALGLMRANSWKRGSIPPRWDGRAGERIVAHLSTLVTDGLIRRGRRSVSASTAK